MLDKVEIYRRRRDGRVVQVLVRVVLKDIRQFSLLALNQERFREVEVYHQVVGEAIDLHVLEDV